MTDSIWACFEVVKFSPVRGGWAYTKKICSLNEIGNFEIKIVAVKYVSATTKLFCFVKIVYP